MADDPLDPQSYRSRAALLRERAASCGNETDRQQLTAVATMFDQLAEKIEKMSQALKEPGS